MKRRVFLSTAAIAAAAAAAGGFILNDVMGRRNFAQASHSFQPYPFNPVDPDGFKQPLFIPSDQGPFGVLDVAGPLTFETQAASFPILDGQVSPFLLYQTEQTGKSYQNPILRMRTGQRMTVKLNNALSDPTIIHWHGLHTPSAMDGGPASTIGPGDQFDYDFTVLNRGGTYWYHTHAHELTAEQAYGGLASFFLVEDEDQQRLADTLDLRLGETDVPLVIQDKQFDAEGRMYYAPGMHDSMAGWLGDVVLCNLTPNAFLEVSPRIYRFRLLNGSNSRVYRLAFMHGQAALAFHVVGSDGGLLDKPYESEQIFLAPGERVDVLFDAAQASPGDEVFIRSLPFEPMGNFEGGGMMGGMMGRMMGGMSSSRLPLGAPFNVMKLSVVEGQRGTRTVPSQLSSIEPIDTRMVSKRQINLDLSHMQFLINGHTYREHEIPVQVKRNTIEIWNIRGPDRGVPHPMHIHGFSFQVLARHNSPSQVRSLARYSSGRMVTDLGWKDTVLVWPGETVQIALDFSHDFVGDQTYVFHCHNLEHEDAGMMINYQVVA